VLSARWSSPSSSELNRERLLEPLNAKTYSIVPQRGGVTQFDVAAATRYVAARSLSAEAKKYIVDAVRNGPSRRVGERAKNNVITDFPSHKAGVTLQCESTTVERVALLHFELDPEIVVLFDQPDSIEVVRRTKNGTTQRGSYRPDFLILRRDLPLVVETKHATEIAKLLASRSDWILVNGQPRYQPAFEKYASMGLEYCVLVIDRIDRIRAANLNTLWQATRGHRPPAAMLPRALKALAGKATMRLSELANRLGVVDHTPLLILITEGHLVADIDSSLLTEPEGCWVSTSWDYLEAAATYTRSAVDSHAAVDRSQTVDIGAPAEKHLKRALHILREIKQSPNTRQARRHRAAIKGAAERGLSALHAVTPKFSTSGTRDSKLAKEVSEYLTKHITEHWLCEARPTAANYYRKYKVDAKIAHPARSPISEKTVRKILDSQFRDQSGAVRGGRRESNALAAPSPTEEREFRPSRPFERATCDHYLCDLFCVTHRKNGKQYFKRAWLTVLVDVATGDLLAYWIDFRSPSRLSCAMVIRACAAAHGRLPEQILTDRGAEFDSVFFSALLATLGIEKLLRPSENARYGSEAERFFGLFKSEWLSGRPGNIVSTTPGRGQSRDKHPAEFAQLDIVDFLKEIKQYVPIHRDTIRGDQRCSPQVRFQEGMARYPFSGIAIEFDSKFILLTAIEERKYSFDPSRGLHIGVSFYWHPRIGLAVTRGAAKLRVKLEPADHHRVYAWVDNEWVVCTTSKANTDPMRDPIVLLADALTSFGARDLKASAREDSDAELVRATAEADKRLSDRPTAEVTPAAPLSRATNDPFSEPVVGTSATLKIRRWA